MRLPRSAAFLLAAVVVVGLLWAAFPPRWESNDDVAMAMVAHGFGGADHPSPQLVFSNIAWGTLVSALGMPAGVPGYTIATFATVALAGAVLFWAMGAAGLGFKGMAAIGGLLLVRAAVFPQFTVGSGLLMLAGCACLAWYPRSKQWPMVVLAAALILASFVIRREECLLVLFVLLPVLPWHALWKERDARLAGLALLLCLAGVSAWDAASYRTPEWKQFNELNPARAAFTDYGRAELLKGRPDILARWGLSNNDVDLVSGWFFADPVLADPVRLRGAVQDLGQLPPQWYASLPNAWEGVTALTHTQLEWLLYAAIFAWVVFPSRRVALAWILCIAVLAGIGYAGRPGVLRIYVPLLGALLLAPFLRQALLPRPPWKAGFRRWVAGSALAVFGGFNAYEYATTWTGIAPLARETALELADFPRETVVVWGDAFPFEDAYPPLKRHVEAGPRLYGLGTFTYAPFGVSAAEVARGRGMVSLLNGKEGVLLLAHDRDVERLAIYCLEHFDGRLETKPVRTYTFARMRRVWCRN